MAGRITVQRKGAGIAGTGKGLLPRVLGELYDNDGRLLNLVPIGAVVLWPVVGPEPNGWLELRGQVVSVRDYPELFRLFGTSFGGDGSTWFTLPDWSTRIVQGNSGANGDTGPPGSYTTLTYDNGASSLSRVFVRFIIRAG